MKEHHRLHLLSSVLRNLNEIPEDDYRGKISWELFIELTNFVLKANPSTFHIGYNSFVSVLTHFHTDYNDI